ncbi:protein kinase [Amycolatopsis sp. DSM 110486]|nr:protein kinase [Amycolatopsis sp. DSM 110486]
MRSSVAAGAIWHVGDEVEGLYRVTAVHSHGGMGLVYRVRHLGWDLDLAVKSPRAVLFRHQAGRDQFVAEAQTWISLGLHPHLCSCYYVRTIDGMPRIFAEYAPDGSVRDLLDSGRPWAPGFRLDLAIQMAWGLDHAHRLGVVHQDVKPANVLLGADGVAKVTDFGLSKSRAILAVESRAGEVTDASVAVTAGGYTPAYASPEQVAGRPLGRRTDVWSYAVTVLETFTGAPTWGAGPNALAALVEHRAAMPAGLARLLDRCLRHDPAERPASMTEIADELCDVYGTEVGPYPRTAPAEAALRADELNNRALSQLDLGEEAQARATLTEALAVDPNHLEATFNSVTLSWRRAEISDDAAVTAMAVSRDAAPSRWEGAYLLGQLHLERGDLDAALPLLRQAAAHDDPEVTTTLQRAEAGELAGPFEEHVLSGEAQLSQEERRDRRMTACAIGADGRVVATGRYVRPPVQQTLKTYLFGYDRPPDEYTLRIFALPDAEARVLEADSIIHEFDFSADGRLLASATENAVHVLDARSGRSVLHFAERQGRVGALRFSPDNKMLAAGFRSNRQVIVVRDVGTGDLVHLLDGHTSDVRDLEFAADAPILASVEDRALRLWNLIDGRCQLTLPHPVNLKAVALSGAAHVVVTGAQDGLHIRGVHTGETRRLFAGAIEDVWLHDKLVAAVGSDGEIRLWDTVDGRCLRTFGGHRDEVATQLSRNEALHIRVSVDTTGRRLHSISNNDTVRSWGLPTGYQAPLRVCRPRTHARMRELDDRLASLLESTESALADGDVGRALSGLTHARGVAGYERDASVVAAWRRLSLATERVGLRTAWLARTIVLPGEANAFWHPQVAVSGDGRRALTTTREHTMVLWDVDTGDVVRTYALDDDRNYISVLDMTVDAVHAVAGDAYRRIHLWDLRTGVRGPEVGEDVSSQMSVAIDRTGRKALLERGDGLLRLWDLARDRELRTFRSPSRTAHFTDGRSRREPEQVNGVALSPDGQVVVSAMQYSGLTSWRGNWWRRRDFNGYADRVDTVRVSADGRHALSGGWDASLRHWDLATGRCLRLMKGHTHPVIGVDLTADGRFAFSAGMDETVRIWDVTTGSCVQVLEAISRLKVVRVSEDGSRAVSFGHDGTLRVWELDWELAAREPADWDDRAQPYLDQHHADESFDELLTRLQRAGLGWLRPDGVRQRLNQS